MDHTDNSLRAAIKALNDVVAPALDPDDALATEQLALVVAYLEFLRDRVDQLPDRLRFELRHQIALARSLTDALPAGPERDALAGARDDAEHVRADGDADTEHIKDATAALAAAVTAVVRAAAAWDPAVRQPVERLVLDASAELIAADRAWFAPMGFDPDPRTVPDLRTALRGASSPPSDVRSKR